MVLWRRSQSEPYSWARFYRLMGVTFPRRTSCILHSSLVVDPVRPQSLHRTRGPGSTGLWALRSAHRKSCILHSSLDPVRPPQSLHRVCCQQFQVLRRSPQPYLLGDNRLPGRQLRQRAEAGDRGVNGRIQVQSGWPRLPGASRRRQAFKSRMYCSPSVTDPRGRRVKDVPPAV